MPKLNTKTHSGLIICHTDIPYRQDPNLGEDKDGLLGPKKDKYKVDVAKSSGILKAKQKLGRIFNSDKLGGIAFTKISKLTMCSA